MTDLALPGGGISLKRHVRASDHLSRNRKKTVNGSRRTALPFLSTRTRTVGGGLELSDRIMKAEGGAVVVFLGILWKLALCVGS